MELGLGLLTLKLIQSNGRSEEGQPDIQVDVEEIFHARRGYYQHEGYQHEGTLLQLVNGRELLVAEPLPYVLEYTCLWQFFIDLQEQLGRNFLQICQEVSARGGELSRGEHGELYITFASGSCTVFRNGSFVELPYT